MNVYYFSSLSDNQPKEVAWETVATEIRSDKLKDLCLRYRALLPEHDAAVADGDKEAAKEVKARMTALKSQCSAFMPQVTLDGGRARTNITGYRPFMIVDIDHIPPEQFPKVERMVKDDEHSRLAYVTISGRGLRVIAQVEGEVDDKNFRDAWLTVNEYYKRLTGLDYDRQCSNATRMCGLAWDPYALYRPMSKRLKINLSLDKRNMRKGKGAGRPPKAKNLGKRVRQRVEADGATYTDGHHNDYVSRCIYLMNRYGVAQDDCTEWAEDEFDDYAATHPSTIRNMVNSVYNIQSDEHATLTVGNGRQRKATVMEVESYVKEHYIVRRNLLSYNLEYQAIVQNEKIKELKNDSTLAQQFNVQPSTFNIVDDHFVNSLWRQMQAGGVNTDLQTINTILGSDFVEDFHPFREWIERLPTWDGETDHIRKFFSLVHYEGVSCEEYHYYTRCWFLAMVASVLDPKVVNHQILTFIGEQGTYKSSFMLHILPPHLRDYFATKNNSYQLDKDDYLMLAENIVISLEEIDSMTTKEVNQLKAFTTMPQVKERPPYGRHKVLMPRVASLTATGNNLTFLSDQTGNRRWLPFHVKCIDNPWTADIPYDGMYAQALALIRQGERYWLNDEDIHTLNARNREFQTPDPAREMIVTYYMQPRTEAETKYMTSSKIAARFAPYMKISPRSIGMALNDLGFEQVRVHAGRFWKVAERPVAEIDSRIPDEKPDEMDFF